MHINMYTELYIFICIYSYIHIKHAIYVNIKHAKYIYTTCYTKTAEIHINFKCPWNIHQDRLHLEPLIKSLNKL